MAESIVRKMMDRAMGAIGYKKDFEPEDLVGGTEIFRQLAQFGMTWTDEKAMRAYKRSLYIFACVSKIAQKVSSIDWNLYKITNLHGDKEELPVHEALDLLYRPNEFQSKEVFWQRYMINKKLTGSAFVLKVRSAGPGSPVVELWNLRPDYMCVLLDPQDVIKGFEFNGPKGKVVFLPEDIIFDSYPDPTSEFGGLSPLQPAQARIEVEEFATRYQRNFFYNNARPDFVLKTPNKITAEQKEDIKEAWDKRHKGGRDQKNVGKGAILEGGLDYQQISLTQREMDYIESLKFTRDDILVALGVPKPIVSITEDVNYANAETAMRVFLSETIVPEVKQLTTVLNEHFVYPEYSDLLFLEFVDPVPENDVQKADVQGKRLTAGTITINEAREEWGMEPIDGGDEVYLPFGMRPIGELSAADPLATDPAADPNADPNADPAAKSVGRPSSKLAIQKRSEKMRVFRGRSKAYKILTVKGEIQRQLVRGVARSMFKDIAKHKQQPKGAIIKADMREAYLGAVLKRIDERGNAMVKPLNNFMHAQNKSLKQAIFENGKQGTKGLAADWKAKLKTWGKDQRQVTAEFSIPYLTNFLHEAGVDAMQTVAPDKTFVTATDRIVAYIKARAKLFATEVTRTTVDSVAETLAEGIAASEGIDVLSSRIDKVYADFPAHRSEMIARTEATAANNKGFIEAYQQSGVANGKEWIATLDGHTRDSHAALNGAIIGLDAIFANGLAFPGDSSGLAEEVINCRCVLGPAFLD